MNFLKEFDFSETEMEKLKDNLDYTVQSKCEKFPMIVKENINYLKNLGIKNYKEIFTKYAYMFLKDPTVFEGIFSKYDVEDLIDKISSNPGIVEYL